jgi:hypothetical protein
MQMDKQLSENFGNYCDEDLKSEFDTTKINNNEKEFKTPTPEKQRHLTLSRFLNHSRLSFDGTESKNEIKL